MSVVFSAFEWRKQPDQMDYIPENERQAFLLALIHEIKAGRISFELNTMYITTPFGGTITVNLGDVLFLVIKPGYPPFISASPPYLAFETILNFEKEEM